MKFRYSYDIIVIDMPNDNPETKSATDKLGEGKILPLVFKLTIPAVIAQLITFLYNIVDRMFVAKIDGSGMDALAALGIVLPITLILQAFANLVGLGGSPRASIKLGENDKDEANKIFNTSFVIFDRNGIRSARSRTQPFHNGARLFAYGYVFCAHRRDCQHRARSSFYFRFRHGRKRRKPCDRSFAMYLVRLDNSVLFYKKEYIQI